MRFSVDPRGSWWHALRNNLSFIFPICWLLCGLIQSSWHDQAVYLLNATIWIPIAWMMTSNLKNSFRTAKDHIDLIETVRETAETNAYIKAFKHFRNGGDLEGFAHKVNMKMKKSNQLIDEVLNEKTT